VKNFSLVNGVSLSKALKFNLNSPPPSTASSLPLGLNGGKLYAEKKSISSYS
jgi:hypothetical protein